MDLGFVVIGVLVAIIVVLDSGLVDICFCAAVHATPRVFENGTKVMQINVLVEDNLFEHCSTLGRVGGPELHELLVVGWIIFDHFPVFIDKGLGRE